MDQVPCYDVSSGEEDFTPVKNEDNTKKRKVIDFKRSKIPQNERKKVSLNLKKKAPAKGPKETPLVDLCDSDDDHDPRNNNVKTESVVSPVKKHSSNGNIEKVEIENMLPKNLNEVSISNVNNPSSQTNKVTNGAAVEKIKEQEQCKRIDKRSQNDERSKDRESESAPKRMAVLKVNSPEKGSAVGKIECEPTTTATVKTENCRDEPDIEVFLEKISNNNNVSTMKQLEERTSPERNATNGNHPKEASPKKNSVEEDSVESGTGNGQMEMSPIRCGGDEDSIKSAIDEEGGEIVKVDESQDGTSAIEPLVEESQQVETTRDESEANEEGKKQMPVLIIQRKDSCYDENEDPFTSFISACWKVSDGQDMQKIVKRLYKHYNRMDFNQKRSNEFTELLHEKMVPVLDKHNPYEAISEVKDAMEEWKATVDNISQQETPNQATVPAQSSQESQELEAPQPGTSTSKTPPKQDLNVSQSKEEQNKERGIKKCQKNMEKLAKKIKILGEREVDFSDDENSFYIQEAEYKKKFLCWYNKYCKLTGEKLNAGRKFKPKKLEYTSIPSINKAIWSYLNAINKRSEDAGYQVAFPTYVDIEKCIFTHCQEEKIELTKEEKEANARKAFEMLAKELQRIRERDFYDTFSWLCDGQESPAEDDELKQKLERNDKEGDTKMNDILDKYVKEQEDKKTGAKSEESEEGDDCDKETDEDADSKSTTNDMDEKNGSLEDSRADESGEDSDDSIICVTPERASKPPLIKLKSRSPSKAQSLNEPSCSTSDK